MIQISLLYLFLLFFFSHEKNNYDGVSHSLSWFYSTWIRSVLCLFRQLHTDFRSGGVWFCVWLVQKIIWVCSRMMKVHPVYQAETMAYRVETCSQGLVYMFQISHDSNFQWTLHFYSVDLGLMSRSHWHEEGGIATCNFYLYFYLLKFSFYIVISNTDTIIHVTALMTLA